jgi:DNA-binding NarL/FixJ family response regulator
MASGEADRGLKSVCGTRTAKARILVVDDHPIVRRGLVQLINRESDLMVCAEADTADEAQGAIKNQQMDLAIVDISLPGANGIILTQELRLNRPHLPVLILTMHDELHYVRQALDAGAAGYVLKHEAVETIITAIRDVLAGKRYISARVAERLSRK